MIKDYKTLKAKTKDDKALKANDRGLNIKSIIFTLKDIWCDLKDKYYEKYENMTRSHVEKRKFYKIMRCHKNKYMTRSHMKNLHND